MKLSIIIPAYNEGDRIRPHLLEIQSFLTSDFKFPNIEVEVIVVADGCSDNTVAVVEDVARQFDCLSVVSYQENRGKGYALKQGFLASKGDYVLFTDADGSTPINEINRLLPIILENQAEIVAGSRRCQGAIISEEQPFYRVFVGDLFSLTTQLLIGIRIRDTQCGFKLFKGNIGRELFALSKRDGFVIDVEILFLAKQRNYRIKEFGISWHNEAGSKVNVIKDGSRMVFFVFKLFVRKQLVSLKSLCKKNHSTITNK